MYRAGAGLSRILFYQEKLNEIVKKIKGHTDNKDGMGDPTDTPQSSKTGNILSLEDAINRVSSTIQKASEDTRARFPDLREMLH